MPADFIRDFTIGLPPIDKQQEIVEYIRFEKGRIDRLIATKHEQLKALTEFKSSVVSDAVTGKSMSAMSLFPNMSTSTTSTMTTMRTAKKQKPTERRLDHGFYG